MIVSIHTIIELNQIFQEKNLAIKIHLRDACGTQSMWLEKLESCTDEMFLKAIGEITDYFVKQNITLHFSDDQMQFHII